LSNACAQLIAVSLLALATLGCSPAPPQAAAPAQVAKAPAAKQPLAQGNKPSPSLSPASGSDETIASRPSPALGASAEEPELLLWEDLMPHGEEEILAKLYDDFYREYLEKLDQQMRGKQTFLTQQGAAAPSTPEEIAEGSSLDVMPQLGTFNTVADLNGLRVRMPGYVVPLDFDAKETYREFLLVPYQGACIHTPPPPPNQIVYVTSAKGARIPDIWGAYWVEGVLSTTRHENDIGSAAYTLTLTSISEYE